MKTFEQFLESIEEIAVGDGAVPLGPDTLAINKRKKKKKKYNEAQDYDSDEVGEVPRDKDFDLDIDAKNKGRLIRKKEIKKLNLLHAKKKES